jgi:hypothetical protein
MASSINPISVTLHELGSYLADNGIEVNLWGKGAAKTVDHLLQEIRSGECELVETGDGLIRVIHVVSANIYYEDTFGMFILKEDKQVFKGGRTKTRSLNTSLSEKIGPNEIPLEGIVRGIKEELNITISSDQIKEVSKFNESRESNSFPGLSTIYMGTRFSCRLNRDQYKPNGYIEVQNDKTVYFKWEKA